MMKLFIILWSTVVFCFQSIAFAENRRTVFAWASGRHASAAVAQLQNSTWLGIINGIQAFCGLSFQSHGLLVNHTEWNECETLLKATQSLGIQFHAVIAGKVPDSTDPQAAISDAIAFAQEYNINGYSLDDEYDCAPRSTLDRFQRWMMYVNAVAQGLQHAQLELSAAVQAMFGIQDVPYNPDCNSSAADCSQACKDPPSSYKLEPRVTRLLADSPVNRWLEMDTYYFDTGRFLNTLDWHVQNIPLTKLGVGLMNRNDLSGDGLLARFHAIDKSNVDWINIFMLPIDDTFLPYLKRWKTHCRGCGVQSTLGCYELSVQCVNRDDKLATESFS